MKPSDTDPLSVKEDLIPRFCWKCGRTLKTTHIADVIMDSVWVYAECPKRYAFFGGGRGHDYIYIGKTAHKHKYNAYTGEEL